MSVLVKIPTQLRAAAGGESETRVEGATVQEVLGGLFERHQELRARIADDDGSLRRFVNVYVDSEDVRTRDGLETPLDPQSSIIVLPAMAGGGR
jgi:sulfur-carrier protein